MNGIKKDKSISSFYRSINHLLKDNKYFFVFIVLMFIFRSAVADWNHVPTGSMRPAILPGDYVWVDKLAYDVQVPFVGSSIYKRSDPDRGDIVVFESIAANKRLIKRVIGIPGDTVSMESNQLTINGKHANYHLIEVDKDGLGFLMNEDIAGREQIVRWEKRNIKEATRFNGIVIPEDYYFMLGDNRDNSRDSRYIGLVPREEIIGRSTGVLLSLNYDNYFLPRQNRFFKKFQ